MASVLFDDRSARVARTSGWERYVRELAPRLAARGVTLSGSPARPLGRLVADVWHVPRAARGHRVAHFPTFPPLRRCAPEMVYTLHDLTWWRFPETASRLGKTYYARAARRAVAWSHLVVHSRAVADEASEYLGVPADRVTVASPGVSASGSSRPAQRPRPYLLVVGTREPRKNLDRLALAYRHSRLSGQVDLLVAGRPAWGRDTPGLDLLGAVSDEELDGLYRGAQAVVVPSLYEGFGLPIAEALARGTPVLCSDIPVFREVGGPHASYFDPYDVEAMSDSLRNLPDQTPAADEARRRWAARYDWDVAASSLVELYGRLGQ